jgi:hypothetical protein
MEAKMRSVLASLTVAVLAGIGSGLAIGDASALPRIESLDVISGVTENVGWRRYYRRHGDLALMPRQRYLPREAPVTAAPEKTTVVVLGPGGCGEFKFWDGTRCMDKRYMEQHF